MGNTSLIRSATLGALIVAAGFALAGKAPAAESRVQSGAIHTAVNVVGANQCQSRREMPVFCSVLAASGSEVDSQVLTRYLQSIISIDEIRPCAPEPATPSLGHSV